MKPIIITPSKAVSPTAINRAFAPYEDVAPFKLARKSRPGRADVYEFDPGLWGLDELPCDSPDQRKKDLRRILKAEGLILKFIRTLDRTPGKGEVYHLDFNVSVGRFSFEIEKHT